LASSDLSGESRAGLAMRFEQYNPVKPRREARNAVAVLMPLNKIKELDRARALPIAALQAV